MGGGCLAQNRCPRPSRQVSGSNNRFVDFVAVRPSDLIDGEETSYTLHERLQNGIFNAGTTTRANVGRFMADLVTDTQLWTEWKGKWPHILNAIPKGAEAAASTHPNA